MDDLQIRRNILNALYALYKRDPLGAIERNDLARKLNLPSTLLDRNIFYLSDRNFVHSESIDTDEGRIYHFVRIAGPGIDLVEDPNEFNAKFPQAVIYQQIKGDYFEVKMGDNNSQVIVGKNIVSVPFGVNNSLPEACKLFVDSLSKNAELDSKQIQTTVAELEKLQQQLTSEEINLGEIQRIKNYLLKEAGLPAADTAALFSHPAVVEPIERALQSLIGKSAS
ncbi:MAG: hypothetical protein HDKAJFGB_02967 [Anaerolineae bacterium]|nr:hypothetical protein [Anaerolineae bacterium]